MLTSRFARKKDSTIFAFTVKINKKDATLTYDDIWSYWQVNHNVKIRSRYPEYDKKGKLHYHGIIKVPRKVFRKNLLLPQMHMKLVPLWNELAEQGWNHYCIKDQDIHYDHPDEHLVPMPNHNIMKECPSQRDKKDFHEWLVTKRLTEMTLGLDPQVGHRIIFAHKNK